MNILTLEQIIQRLQLANLSKVAKATGLSRQYISGILNGANTNPSYNVMKKLSEALEGNEK